MTDRTRNAEILAKRRAGQTIASIGKEYGITKTAVCYRSVREDQLQSLERISNGMKPLSSIRAQHAIAYLLGEEPTPLPEPVKVAQLKVSQVLDHPNAGRKTLTVINEYLAQYDLKLRDVCPCCHRKL